MHPLLLGATAIAVLSLMDAVIKYLTLAHTVTLITFGRYATGAIFAGALWWARGGHRFDRGMLRFHTARGVLIAIAGYGFFFGLSRLPLAEAITISFIAPLITPLLAWALLGERVRPAAIAAGLIGFLGVLVAVQGAPPSADTPQRTAGVVAVLVSAVTYSLGLVLLRARAGRDGPLRVGLLSAAVPALILAPFALAQGDLPQPQALPLFLAMGLLGTAGMYLFVLAYGRAQAQLLAPLEFTALGWAAFLGFLIFAEAPRPQVFAGAAIIVAATLIAGWDERRSRALRPRTKGSRLR